MNPETQEGTSSLTDEGTVDQATKSGGEEEGEKVNSTESGESASGAVVDEATLEGNGEAKATVETAEPIAPAEEVSEAVEVKDLTVDPVADTLPNADATVQEEAEAVPVLTLVTDDPPVEAIEVPVPAQADAGTATMLEEGESTASLQSSTPAIQKKFTSLNVNKRFLEKASPTLAAVPAPVVSKAASAQPTSRLSSITPASRLTSAKLTSIKSQPAGWGQVGPSSNPSSPGVDALPSLSASMNVASIGSGAAAPGKVASPKLVTALTSGSIVRSTSPQNKGSPGLRNAALSSSGRTASPSITAPPSSTSNKVPWAKVKADAASAKLSSDFPTAAEAARAKLEAERKEKAAAAEAAAKSEQALQYLERFRGASLGVGNHWDEMDDEDDLDEVVQFGDGTQYKVPVEAKEEPVTKEERFKDVGHDRSWPPKAGQARPPPVARTPSVKEPSVLPPSSTDGQPPRPFSSRIANKVEIRGAEGISLEADTLDRGYPPQREGRSFYRGRDTDVHAATTHAPASAAAAVPARAWGPLAQRQASLNPDAPKPAIVSPPSVPKPASILPPVREKSQERTPVAAAPAPATAPAPAPAPPRVSPPSASAPKTGTNERALPPHLAASHAAAQKLAPLPSTKAEVETRGEIAHATPYGARFGTEANAAAPSRPPVTSPLREEKPMSSVVNQREEMLSAAERARKRRQEEEEKRLAEKERAKAKAAAIEEKMRLAEEEQKKKAEEARQNEEAARQEKVKAEEATRGQQADRYKGRNDRPEVVTNAVVAAPAVLSPGDEAVSWRRSKAALAAPFAPPPLAPVAAEIPERVTVLQRAAPAPSAKQATAKASRSPSTNEHDLASSTGMEGWDVVINRIKDAIPAPNKSEMPVPTGPRLSTRPVQTDAKSMLAAQVKLPSKAPKVEIIAPNDEGAARQRVVEQKQKEARHTQGLGASPISVLKSRAVISAPESPTTSTQVAFDAPPVWNKYKIKVGPSTPPVRLARHLVKAQAVRVANFKSESSNSHSRPPYLLTWEPPIPNLSTRTLSRDDLFFPKKYRKGTVITNVTIPKARLERRAAAVFPQKTAPVVKIPASSSVSRAATTGAPRAPASMRGKDTSASKARDASSPVAFARSLQPRDSTPSPVSFMVTSELKTGEEVLPVATSVLAATSSVLPSPNPAAATWGQSSLTFPDLDQRVAADPNHLRDVWALPSNESASMQNSLRGIVDEEFPDVPAQYHEVGINTGESHHSAPTSRVYSPLTGNDKRSTDTSNGFTSITSASSPSTTKSSPQARLSTNGYSPSMVKTPFQSDPRRSASNAFSAYAYPSPLQDYGHSTEAGFFPAQQQQQQQQARAYAPNPQQYGQLEPDYNNAGGGYNRFRGAGGAGPMSPSGMPMMNGTAAPWIENPYGMQRHHQQQQQQPGAYMASPQSPHHQRISSSATNMRNSYNNQNNNNSRGGATMRPFRGNVDNNVW